MSGNLRIDNLRVDSGRLWDSIMETAAFGATQRGGVKRLTLSDEDAKVRRWLIAAGEQAGCTVQCDDMGNIFLRRPGRDETLPPIAIGSHLDTQPTGGKFDGILGVLAGLEVLRTLNDSGFETHAPIEVIDWTNEEGSRFPPAMLASGVFAGVFSRDDAYSRTDREGVTFGAALAGAGFKGAARCGAHPLSAFFELHIEQGPILEAEQKTIGIVTGIQAMRWFEVTVSGMAAHAGTTPMALRNDALAPAARMIEAVHQTGLGQPDAVATVGLVELRPNSRNVIPGEVFFTVDLRHPDDAVLERMEAALRDAFDVIITAAPARMELARIWDCPAVHFDEGCIGAVADAAAALGHPARRITSGAGHDAGYIARIAPAGMIFIPCESGISHNEIEMTEPAQVAAGADVLLHAVLATDARLAAARR